VGSDESAELMVDIRHKPRFRKLYSALSGISRLNLNCEVARGCVINLNECPTFRPLVPVNTMALLGRIV
jgi:hypothetical protein